MDVSIAARECLFQSEMGRTTLTAITHNPKTNTNETSAGTEPAPTNIENEN